MYYFIVKVITIILFIIVVSYINTLQQTQQQTQQQPQQQPQQQKPLVEGFYINNYDLSRKWSPNIVQQFLYTQQSLNDPTQIQFDMDKVQEQATEEEAKYFIANKKWKWNDEVQQLYMDAVMNNTYIRSDPYESLKHAMTIYNQTAILELLSLFQTKEGHFLLKGYQVEGGYDTAHSGTGTYAVNSGLETNSNKLIRCNYKPSTKLPPYSESQPSTTANAQYNNKNLSPLNFLSPDITPQTTSIQTTTPLITTQPPVQTTIQNKKHNTYTEKRSQLQEIDTNGPFVVQTKEITDYKSLPSLISGFTFLNEPCNPCTALDESRDQYSCPFIIKNGVNTNSYPSSIWRYLWFSHPENKVQKPYKEIDLFINNPKSFNIWEIAQNVIDNIKENITKPTKI